MKNFKIVFLGSGCQNGTPNFRCILSKKDCLECSKNQRYTNSIMILYNNSLENNCINYSKEFKDHILIDTTHHSYFQMRNFLKKYQNFNKKFPTVILSNSTIESTTGLNTFCRMCYGLKETAKSSVYCIKDITEIIKKAFFYIDNINFIDIEDKKIVKNLSIKIQPIITISDNENSFLGFIIEDSIGYFPYIKDLSKILFIEKLDVFIIGCNFENNNLTADFEEIKEFCKNKNFKRIILTGISHKLSKEIITDAKFEIAYDLMEL